jgi:SRSO17 transposase
LSPFRKQFEGNKKSLFQKARWVVEGLLSAPLKNLQVIAQSIGKSDYQALQHFLSNSVWDWTAIEDEVAKRFYKLVERLGSLANLCLIIDESGIAKKGKESAGVAHQYCGSTGKNDNCQVGVFAALCSGTLVSIIQSRLYLPACWTSSRKRMDKAGVPPECRTHKSKIDMTWEMIVDVKKRLKIPFKWVVFDAFYGRDLDLLGKLHKQAITFMAQIPSSHRVFLKDFSLRVPKPTGTRGRKPTRLKPTASSVGVEAYAKTLKAKEWKKLTIRSSSKGELRAYFHRVRVWLLDEESLEKYQFTLLIRKDLNGDVSCHLTNSTAHLQRLTYMQGQRYFVERAFRDAKQQLGMDQYQVRSYSAWHKHMALVMMAHLFIQLEKAFINPTHVQVSTQDVVKVISCLITHPTELNKVIKLILTKNKTLFAKIRYLTK